LLRLLRAASGAGSDLRTLVVNGGLAMVVVLVIWGGWVGIVCITRTACNDSTQVFNSQGVLMSLFVSWLCIKDLQQLPCHKCSPAQCRVFIRQTIGLQGVLLFAQGLNSFNLMLISCFIGDKKPGLQSFSLRMMCNGFCLYCLARV
jgi:hypothetical protein